MSLINQMLKDLEQRRQHEKPQVAAVTAVSAGTGAKKLRLLPWLVGVVVITMVAGSVYWWSGQLLGQTISLKTGALLKPELAVEPLAEPGVEPEPVTIPSDPVVLVASRLSEESSQLRLVLEFNRQATVIRLASSSARQLQLQINADISVSLSHNLGTLIDGLSVVASEKANLLLLNTTQEMTWQQFVLPADSGHGWRLVLQAIVVPQTERSPAVAEQQTVELEAVASKQLNDSAVVQADVIEHAPLAPAVVAVKQPLTTVKQQWVRLQKQATLARQQGRWVDAQQLLQQLLTLDEQSAVVRRELVTVLVQQQRLSQAIDVAEQGRQQNSGQQEQLSWLMLEARLLAETGQTEQALTLLHQQSAPTLSGTPDYYALQAVLLQKVGDYQQAAQRYQALCTGFPRHGEWWLGWAVSEAQLGHRSQAIRYFEQALATGGLSIRLQQYAAEQLGRLRESR
ncbi:MAG: tetratricopeptide repeat protein [Desulfuromonas sp.]|nr:tetratricopeptide repeat protein [Desulfuromonas sp.]